MESNTGTSSDAPTPYSKSHENQMNSSQEPGYLPQGQPNQGYPPPVAYVNQGLTEQLSGVGTHRVVIVKVSSNR